METQELVGTTSAVVTPSPQSSSRVPRVLGLDPGLHRTGYAVVEGGARPTIVEAGLMRINANGTLAHRLRTLHDSIVELIGEAQPTAVAVEELFGHYDRPRTAILMGHARGVLLLAAARAGLEVASYLPTRVKKFTTGAGRASKAQMQRAVQLEFGLAQPPEPPDVADALAIALCHLHSTRCISFHPSVRSGARGRKE